MLWPGAACRLARMGAARSVGFVALVVLAGCGGRAKLESAGEHESGATGGHGVTGVAGALGNSGVAGAPSDIGTTDDGGAPSYATGSGPITYAPPATGQVWPFQSEEPFEFDPPVIVAVDDDVILAATSSDSPATGSNDPPRAPGFVSRLTNGQTAWQVTLPTWGQPAAIARSGDDVVVVGPTANSESITLAKVGVDGTVRYETPLPLVHPQPAARGLAVDDSGAIFLVGSYGSGGGEHVLFVKCDADGNVLWEKTFDHSGTEASANSVAVLTGGDVVITGTFDLTLSFGGSTDTLTSTASGAGDPVTTSGFVVRFSPDGDPRWSSTFGAQGQADGIALAALADDYFLVAGDAAPDGSFSFAGQTWPWGATDGPTPSVVAFVALVDGEGQPAWVTLDQNALVGYSVAADGAGTVLLGGMMDASALNSTYLRTYAVANGNPAGTLKAMGGNVMTGSIAVAPNGSVWLSGGYGRQADLGNQNLLMSQAAGLFIIRIEPE